jgi:L-asparaginase II
MANPVLVNCWRGDIIENRHRGAIAVCDPNGRLIQSWGDVDALVYPRSAVKLLQALPLIESGAADHFHLDETELALACSSHGAEPAHTEAVKRWLERIELDEGALECGPNAPNHLATAQEMLKLQREYGRIHNCCSGKHTSMLTISHFLGEETRGYIEREHPAQQRWFDALGEMADIDLRGLPWNRDGCGIPVIAMPLSAMATAFARVAVPDDLASGRADAINRLGNAIATNPFMIAGSGRLGSAIIELSGRRTLVKSGADGVYVAALQEQGLGVALKIDDGNSLAAEVAILSILSHLGGLHADELAQLDGRCRIPISNTRGVVTGYRKANDL